MEVAILVVPDKQCVTRLRKSHDIVGLKIESELCSRRMIFSSVIPSDFSINSRACAANYGKGCENILALSS